MSGRKKLGRLPMISAAFGTYSKGISDLLSQCHTFCCFLPNDAAAFDWLPLKCIKNFSIAFIVISLQMYLFNVKKSIYNKRYKQFVIMDDGIRLFFVIVFRLVRQRA